MVDPINITAEAASTILAEIGRIGLWLQAIGLFVVFWIGFQIYSFYTASSRRHTLADIKNDLRRIERKLDKIIKK